jgi:hypothetical protein
MLDSVYTEAKNPKSAALLSAGLQPVRRGAGVFRDAGDRPKTDLSDASLRPKASALAPSTAGPAGRNLWAFAE